MQEKLEVIRKELSEQLMQVKTTEQLEELKGNFLGKKGKIASLMQALRDVPVEEKPTLGKEINLLKHYVSEQIDQTYHSLQQAEEEKKLGEETLDVSLPGRRKDQGRQHPINAFMEEILSILKEMGFSIQYGPDIESDYYNFEALNFPEDHPARDMHDTYYLTSDMLLRTHTSNVQIRVMEMEKPPIRFVAPGTVYRNESVSARSHVFFHQVEGMYVDKGVSFADLMATLNLFLEKLFHKGIETRYRASYFPFVEPGLEVDVKCLGCEGKGCVICSNTGWLEILGAGMVHPEVLKGGGIDPEVYSGYAWGMGIDRLLMIRNGIKDIRILTQNDMRFLRQFA